jgi:hypothetical protein
MVKMVKLKQKIAKDSGNPLDINEVDPQEV